MSEGQQKSWILRPRYHPLDLGIFLLVGVAVAVMVSVWITASVAARFVQRLDGRLQEVLAIAVASPLPAVKLAEQGQEDPNAYRHAYTFTTDWFTSRLPSWKVAMAPFVGRPGLNYLEIGTFEGRSLFWVLDNVLTDPTARATVIDTFDGPYVVTYQKNLETSGNACKVNTLTGYSQVALRPLPLDSFDLIYVDGSHRPADVLQDAVLCWQLLRVGGLIIFDDYANVRIGHDYQATMQPTGETWYPKKAIDPFVQCLGEQCQVVHNDFQLILRKTRE